MVLASGLSSPGLFDLSMIVSFNAVHLDRLYRITSIVSDNFGFFLIVLARILARTAQNSRNYWLETVPADRGVAPVDNHSQLQ
jgi:hypothetical protein